MKDGLATFVAKPLFFNKAIPQEEEVAKSGKSREIILGCEARTVAKSG